jgi:hypothetical protein
LNVQIQVIHGGQRAVTLGQTLNFDGIYARSPSP